MSTLGVTLAVLAIAVLTAGAMAVRSVSRIWLRHWVERGFAGASLASLYLERPQRLLVAASTAVACAAFLAGAALAAGATVDDDRLRALAIIALRAVIAALLVVFVAQPVARAVARRWAVPLVPMLVPVLRVADALVAPGRLAGVALSARARGAVERQHARVTAVEPRTDLEDLLREGELEGVSEQDELAIISGVVQFADKHARDVMTPRAQLFALDLRLAPAEIAAAVAQSGYSRVPVYRGTIDDIVGIVHAFDVLKTAGESMPPILPVYNAAANVPCNDLLFAMLRARRHLAIVREDGRTIGVLTLEDLLEQLVGEINDEHDEPRATSNMVMPAVPPSTRPPR